MINADKKCANDLNLEAQQTVQAYCNGVPLQEGDHSDSHNLFLTRLVIFAQVNLVLTY